MAAMFYFQLPNRTKCGQHSLPRRCRTCFHSDHLPITLSDVCYYRIFFETLSIVALGLQKLLKRLSDTAFRVEQLSNTLWDDQFVLNQACSRKYNWDTQRSFCSIGGVFCFEDRDGREYWYPRHAGFVLQAVLSVGDAIECMVQVDIWLCLMESVAIHLASVGLPRLFDFRCLL